MHCCRDLIGCLKLAPDWLFKAWLTLDSLMSSEAWLVTFLPYFRVKHRSSDPLGGKLDKASALALSRPEL